MSGGCKAVAGPRRNKGRRTAAVPGGRLRFGWQSYLAAAPGSPDVPSYASPARHEDLSGLPPAWISVGDIDLFHDEDQDYANRPQAGVDATFHVVSGAPHGFEAWAAKATGRRFQ